MSELYCSIPHSPNPNYICLVFSHNRTKCECVLFQIWKIVLIYLKTSLSVHLSIQSFFYIFTWLSKKVKKQIPTLYILFHICCYEKNASSDYRGKKTFMKVTKILVGENLRSIHSPNELSFAKFTFCRFSTSFRLLFHMNILVYIIITCSFFYNGN